MFVIYICFELPLKKLIKNMFYKSEDNSDDINDDDDDDNNDNDNDNDNDDNDKGHLINKDNEPKIFKEFDENKLILKDEDEEDEEDDE